ncbi:hypothetical protein VP01_881g8 [Puccinia sorghi]|uniref:Uncharacterized protein n=1 Tax=Puccinia sorghi TaxID=27349 RepID=A0A0L6UAH5_9BASI|nr:hypothetical protein VP01_881g8 [Puccinia sorghi]
MQKAFSAQFDPPTTSISPLAVLNSTSRIKSPNKTPLKANVQVDEEAPSKDPIQLRFVLCFIVWLHLFCGVIHAKCRTAVTYILYIIKRCCELAPDIDFESCVPVEIQTITKHLHLDPRINEYVCCRRCYLLYDIEAAPPECGYQQTTNSDNCGEDLFVPSTIYHLDKVQRASVQRILKTPAPKPHLTNLANIFFTQPFTTREGFMHCL